MGYAAFPLLPDGRVLVDAAKVVAVQEAPPGGGSGLATLWLDSGTSWRCSENVTTVYARIVEALATDGIVGM